DVLLGQRLQRDERGVGRMVRIEEFAMKLIVSCAMFATVLSVHARSQTTTLVSVDSSGVPANSFSFAPVISADARFVAFVSKATNLVPGDTNNAEDVFVHDLATGATTRVSIASDGTQALMALGHEADYGLFPVSI